VLRLCVLDFSGPAADLAGQLGVPKAAVWERKDERSALSHNRRLPRAVWETEATSRGSLLLGGHVSRFLDTLGTLRDRLRVLRGEYEAALRCHINDYGKGYVIYCDPNVVRHLADINASLEVVIHAGEDEAEAPHRNSIDLGFIPEVD